MLLWPKLLNQKMLEKQKFMQFVVVDTQMEFYQYHLQSINQVNDNSMCYMHHYYNMWYSVVFLLHFGFKICNYAQSQCGITRVKLALISLYPMRASLACELYHLAMKLCKMNFWKLDLKYKISSYDGLS